MKKFLSVVLSVLLCFSAFSVVAYAEETGDPLTYEIGADGFVTIADCDESAEGEIVIPAFVDIDDKLYEVKYIGDSAFADCTLLTTIILSEGIEQIGDFAFLNCTALADLYIPESLLVCMYTAFNGCNSMVVHCYSTNYQFFTVFGIIQNLRIDIIDSEDDNLDIGVGGIGAIDMTNTILLIIKRVMQLVVYFLLNFGTGAAPEVTV